MNKHWRQGQKKRAIGEAKAGKREEGRETKNSREKNNQNNAPKMPAGSYTEEEKQVMFHRKKFSKEHREKLERESEVGGLVGFGVYFSEQMSKLLRRI